jgi:AAA ATPase domain
MARPKIIGTACGFDVHLQYPGCSKGCRVSRRPIALVLDALLLLLGTLLGLATNYATSQAGELPYGLRLLQQWALPLVGVTLLLILAGQVWLYLLERPPSPKRIWNSSRPPYPGLEAFTEQDAAIFFGREAEIAALLDRLQPTLADPAHRFMAVIGPSGVGKSSLVQAGLIPRLAKLRSRWVVVPPLVPEDQPTRSLAYNLAAVLPSTSVDALSAELGDDSAALVRPVEQLRAASGGRAVSVLLVIDQAEELLTESPRVLWRL